MILINISENHYEPIEEGQKAGVELRETGKGTENPHPPTSMKYDCWEVGYISGCRDWIVEY